ncbi:MAG: phosphoribosylamine--glycine ligase [Kiritimatiellae bacterium]|nr:phosphoribosylamine--glycine ligase [Kiritimatiellia bacterium]
MKIFIIGGGGREHAIAWRVSKDSCAPDIYCAPGNAGTATIATNLAIAADDLVQLREWALCNKPDLTIVGPEVPLCLGITDLLEAEGLRVFGPCCAAARLEGSKAFSKEIMLAAGVPTAKSLLFNDPGRAIAALDSFGLPVVIKADGLAAGKGVIIAATKAEAVEAIQAILVDSIFGEAGAEILIEEFLVGEEASILALVDGEHAVILPSSQDHKRVYNNDEGPNTGGMGAYTPAPVVTDALLPLIKTQIIMPVVCEMKKRGCPYKGVLYAGLMISADGIKVLEFNTRFGDPETEAILPRIAGDIIPALEACVDGTLRDDHIIVRDNAAVTVVMASGGYPGRYSKGLRITGIEDADALDECVVFHAGTRVEGGAVVTDGGRVLSVTASGEDLKQAVERAYQAVSKISFEGAHYRTDIAARAFNR